MKDEDLKKMDLIKDGAPNPQAMNNVEGLRKQFLETYCQKKGWDSRNLTIEQINEISSKKEYKNPNMILG